MIGLLIALVIFCVVVWAAQQLLAAFSIQDPIKTVVWVAVVIIALLILLGMVNGSGYPHISLH
jgi:uncharacterized membrane protein